MSFASASALSSTNTVGFRWCHVFEVARGLNQVYNMEEVFAGLLPAAMSSSNRQAEVEENAKMAKRLFVIHRLMIVMTDKELASQLPKVAPVLLLNFVHLEMCLFMANRKHILKTVQEKLEEVAMLEHGADDVSRLNHCLQWMEDVVRVLKPWVSERRYGIETIDVDGFAMEVNLEKGDTMEKVRNAVKLTLSNRGASIDNYRM